MTSNAVAGGDSWFSSSNGPSSLILAKGGAGGNSAVGNTTSTAYATGGLGTTNGSIGNVLYAGGSGANGISGFAGGGGSGAASTTNGVTATNNLGAVSTAGGGSGGTGPTSGSLSGTNGFAPGGGGAGSRNSSGIVTAGASGGSGQIILTVQALAKAGSTISVTGSTSFTYNGSAQGPNTSTVTGSGGAASYSYEGVSGTSYTASGTRPTAVGSYRVTATVPEDTNYNTATSSAYAFTIVTSGTTYATYLSDNNLPADTAFDAKVNGVAVGLKYAFGSASGMPQNNGVTAVPVIDQLPNGNSQLTYTFDVKDDSPPLTITYQTSSDLVTWTAAKAVSSDTGAAPTGFLKKQVQVNGSDRLFIRLNVTR